MKNTALAIALFIVLGGLAHSQTEPKEIAAIRKVYTETNARLTEMEKQPELSSVFAVELTVNKFSAPYPAVGIYQRTATFYYTFGDREKNPYPDRLLKITASYKRSARTETAEFYFNALGGLVFVLVTDPGSANAETRLHYAAGKLIRLTDGGKEVRLSTQRAREAGTLIAKEAARLQGIFKAALIDYD